MFLPFLFPFFLLLVACASSDLAWKGSASDVAQKPSFFTPYWVPEGAKSYDSASPLIHYTGRWNDVYSSGFIHNSMRSTSAPGAYVSFTFTGSGIEWFGNTDKGQGLAQVFLDGVLVKEVDAFSPIAYKQQRLFWKYDLPSSKHTLKIVNVGKRPNTKRTTKISVDAFVVTKVYHSPKRAPLKPREQSTWQLTQEGSTGVHAMQLTVISNTHALIVDKVEHNPLTIDGHPAWAALYNLQSHSVGPLRVQSNSFCAGGSFLSNGTLVNVGGNPVMPGFTSSADFGNLNGLQAIRIMEPCDDLDKCQLYEHHERIRMASPRWYNTVIRIPDGSVMIIGGSKAGGWINNATVNNPTIEYFPPKSIHGSNGLPIQLPFLMETLNSNLFPIAFCLPDGRIFIAANNDAMIYDWKFNTELRLPKIPNGVRVTYPMSGSALLLPLSPENDYTAEILICGGSTIDDTRPSFSIDSQEPASAQCSRISISNEGIQAGWQIEEMPAARLMPDMVLLPTGDIVIVNGAGSGIAGYGNVKHQVGASNADHPILSPVLYHPHRPSGERFSEGLGTSSIPRVYHSVATLTPQGNVLIAGSNPNLDRSSVLYGTEYRVEWLNPPYMDATRPYVSPNAMKHLHFGETARLPVKYESLFRAQSIKVVLMDLGYITHAVHANSRFVYLESSLKTDSEKGDFLAINGPPNENIYPPGPGFLFVVVDGIPSSGIRIMVGNGQGPDIDHDALDNMLQSTPAD